MANSGTQKPGLGFKGFILLAALTGLSPLSNIFILPALPQVATQLSAELSTVQLALSAGFAGLAFGLIVVGPLSDVYGRRKPLLIGLVCFVVFTALCAVSPNVHILVVLRVLQGASGGAIWVIARALVRDVFEARSAARMFSQLSMVTGLAPIVAPIIAGQLLLVVDWRGLFVVLAVLAVSVTVLAVLFFRESLTLENRSTGGFSAQTKTIIELVSNRYFASYLLVGIVQSSMYFTFLLMSPFVFQVHYGVDVQGFSAIFACAACAIVLGNQSNVWLLRRGRPDTLLSGFLMLAVLGSVLALVAVLSEAPLSLFVAALVIVTFSSGASNSNITALAMAPFGRAAGSAAALLGACQFAVGALAPPLLSLIGTTGLVMTMALVCTSLSALILQSVFRKSNGRTITQLGLFSG